MSCLICFALKEEAAPFQKIATRKPGTSILITGIGRANAEKSVRAFLSKNSPELVLTCGFAGGLNPDLKIGDVIFDKPATCNLQLTTFARPAKIFCADRIATTVAEKSTLFAQTGADAVEMESAAIHAVCAEQHIPCTTVRVVSDTAHEDLPLDFNTLAKPDKNLDFSKLFWAIARSPNKIPQLMALQKKTKFAAQQLAVVLEKIISP